MQFRGSAPVFIDTLSFEARREGEPWVAYRQFCEHFLAPLALMARRDARLSGLWRAHLDGVPLDLASRLLPRSTWLRFGLLTHLHLHARSQAFYADRPAPSRRVAVGRTSLLALLDSLRRTVRALAPREAPSEWADYERDPRATPTSPSGRRSRSSRAGSSGSGRARSGTSGRTSAASRRIAASRRGLRGVASTSTRRWSRRPTARARFESRRDLLPLVLDLANPSPGLGWEGRERDPLEARGPADALLALALVHHLAIGRNVPLPRIAAWMARLGRSAIVEFVPKDDPQTRQAPAVAPRRVRRLHAGGLRGGVRGRLLARGERAAAGLRPRALPVARQGLTRALAALFPPLAVLSSAHELYLRNQLDLGRTLSVLFPFWAAAAAAVLLALLLQRAERLAPARLALAAYYARRPRLRGLGLPARPARGQPPRALGPRHRPRGVAVRARLARRRRRLRAARSGPRRSSRSWRCSPPSSSPRESVALATPPRPQPRAPAPRRRGAVRARRGSRPAERLPLPPRRVPGRAPRALPSARRPRGARRVHALPRRGARCAPPRWSCPTILTGRSLAGTVEERLREAFSGETSLFRRLGRAGYRTVAFGPRFLYGRTPAALDLVVLHEDNAREPDLAGLQRATFLRLWVYGTLPRSVARASRARPAPRLRHGFLPDGLDGEAVHLRPADRLPAEHGEPAGARAAPSRARAATRSCTCCSRTTPTCCAPTAATRAPPGRSRLREQTECTLLLLVRFLETLRRLDRLDGSVVVVHGDHGSGEVLRDGRLVPDEGGLAADDGPGEARLCPRRDARRGGRPRGSWTSRPPCSPCWGSRRERRSRGARCWRRSPLRGQAIGRSDRAGTPATSVRGGTSAVTTLPAATND